MAHHGNTPAAWTGVTIVLLGFTLGGIALMVDSWPLFWVGGVALAVVGVIVGKVMQRMGLGAEPNGERDAEQEPASGSPH